MQLRQRVQFLPKTGLSPCREILETADFVSSKNGGEGAVREFLEYILKKENSWNKIVQSN